MIVIFGLNSNLILSCKNPIVYFHHLTTLIICTIIRVSTTTKEVMMKLSEISTKTPKIFIEVDWDAVQYCRHTDSPDGSYTIPAQVVAQIVSHNYIGTGQLDVNNITLVRNAIVWINDAMVAQKQYRDICLENDKDIDFLYVDGIDDVDEEFYSLHDIELDKEQYDNLLLAVITRLDNEINDWIKTQNAMDLT